MGRSDQTDQSETVDQRKTILRELDSSHRESQEEDRSMKGGEALLTPDAGAILLTEDGDNSSSGGGNGRMGMASFANTEPCQAKQSVAGYPSGSGVNSVTTTPQDIMRFMEQKERFLEEIQPQPTPIPTESPSLSMPGAFRQYSGRPSPTVSRAVMDGSVEVNEHLEHENEGHMATSDEESPSPAMEHTPEGQEVSACASDLFLNSGFFTTATAVEESEVEEEIRRRILSQVVEADVVHSHDHLEDEELRRKKSRSVLFSAIGVVGMVMAIATVLIVFLPGKVKDSNASSLENTEPTGPPKTNLTMPTIELVRNRSVLRCGVVDAVPGFSSLNAETGAISGLNIDHCHAISLAVFGSPDNVEFVWIHPRDRFQLLENGTIDVLSMITTHTMGRDVFEASSESGFAFTVPFFYTGLLFCGLPEYVDCADKLDSLYGNCRFTKACVVVGTTNEFKLGQLLPGISVIPSNSVDEMVEHFAGGDCHIVASEIASTPEERFRDAGYTGEFKFGQVVFSDEPLALVTRKGDTDWSNLIGFIVNCFYLAEANGISKSNSGDVSLLLDSNNSDNNSKDLEMIALMEALISEFGHYGDLYEKNLQHIMPRLGANTLYNGTELEGRGLLYFLPFGATDTLGMDPLPGLLLDTILRRGRVRCGILDSSLENEAFAAVDDNGTWSGFDVEFCRALAASLFLGDANAVVFHRLENGNATSVLVSHDVDVISGSRVTLQADYQGFSFSTPYYYDDVTMDTRALMTLDVDGQWSDFVYWVVMALVYAEDQGISNDSASSMPVVNLFGGGLKQMLGDCVIGVGSYADIYNRTLAATIPRGVGNMLNTGPLLGPQQFPIPFV